ncbi:MAG: HigA family addiction module antitoxin [Bacteroidales bacterium]
MQYYRIVEPLQLRGTDMNTTLQGVDPEMIANNLTPAYSTHPGEILKDEIEYRGISQRKLAAQMGLTYSVLNEILNARRPMTEKTALLFEAALGLDAEPLMRLQLKYNMQTTRKDETFMERLAQVRKIASML